MSLPRLSPAQTETLTALNGFAVASRLALSLVRPYRSVLNDLLDLERLGLVATERRGRGPHAYCRTSRGDLVVELASIGTLTLAEATDLFMALLSQPSNAANYRRAAAAASRIADLKEAP